MKKVIISPANSTVGTCADNGILFSFSEAGSPVEVKNVTDSLGGTAKIKSLSFVANTSGASPAVDVFFFKKKESLGDRNSVPSADKAAAAAANCLGKVHFPSVDEGESIFITDVTNNERYVSVKNNVDLIVESNENSQSIYYIGIAREAVNVASALDFKIIFGFE